MTTNHDPHAFGRLLDVVDTEDALHKALLLETEGHYSIVYQTHGRNPVAKTQDDHLTESEAFQKWEMLVQAMFSRVTHNPADARALAARRIATFH